MMVQILDVMQKALKGKPMSESDYQLRSKRNREEASIEIRSKTRKTFTWEKPQ